MSPKENTEWFQFWFDSEYYHILYGNRDSKEAESFIDQLVRFLKIPSGSRILDMPCGKGRHSVYLEKKGFDVTGIDLSARSIEAAKKYENKNLSFYIHDMRKPFRVNCYDVVLNLFTSIGYFEKEKDNKAVIHSAAMALKPNSFFVLDFMNTKKILASLVKNEKKVVEGLEFNIERFQENKMIVKKINFTCSGEEHSFQERVQALTMKDFENYFESTGLKILHLFGDYTLQAFDEDTSDRLIIIAKKNK